MASSTLETTPDKRLIAFYGLARGQRPLLGRRQYV